MAAGTYPRPAGTYVVTAKYNGPRGHDGEAASLLPSEEAGHSGQGGQGGHGNGEGGNGEGNGWGYGKTWTWTIVIDGTPVCPVLTKVANPATGTAVEKGDVITYTITVYNGGDATSTDPVVDTLPVGVSTPSSISDGGLYDSTARDHHLDAEPRSDEQRGPHLLRDGHRAVRLGRTSSTASRWDGPDQTTTHLPPGEVPCSLPPSRQAQPQGTTVTAGSSVITLHRRRREQRPRPACRAPVVDYSAGRVHRDDCQVTGGTAEA